MSDQWQVSIFCILLGVACSFTVALFYEVSIGRLLRHLKSKPINKAMK